MQYYVQVFEETGTVGDEKPRQFAEQPPSSMGYFEWLPCNYGDYIPGRSMIGDPVIYADRVEYPITRIADSVLLEQTKKKQYQAIRAEGAKLLKNLRGDYGDLEASTWFKQEQEARAYLADANAPTPMLSAIAGNRGITVAELVDKVMENVNLFEAAAGTILGKQQAILDYISNLTVEAEVLAISSWRQYDAAIAPQNP